MTFKPFDATWFTWNDATGDEIAVPVTIIDEFYEEDDPVVAYNLVLREEADFGLGVRPVGYKFCGIDGGSFGR